MSAGDTIAVAGILAGPVLSVAALWLRLRYRLRRDRERRHYLLTATALPAGSRVTEHRSDGSRLTLTVGATGPSGGTP